MNTFVNQELFRLWLGLLTNVALLIGRLLYRDSGLFAFLSYSFTLDSYLFLFLSGLFSFFFEMQLFSNDGNASP